MIKKFLRWNISICDRIEDLLPGEFTRSLLYLHELTAGRLMNSRAFQVVLDVGGGRLSPFANHRRPELRTTIIGLDISESELRVNQAIDHAVVADAGKSLPFRTASLDIVTTRSVVEHLYDIDAFLSESSRVLKANGQAVHVFPCRFAIFAMLNQILPHKLARSTLHYIFPQWKDTCGFRAYYNKCYYPRILLLLESNGFEIEQTYIRYYQSIYFKFFVPFYCISLLYDFLLWAFDVRFLCGRFPSTKRFNSSWRIWRPRFKRRG